MAFVSRAERKLHTVDSSSIGPGAYLDISHYASNQSFAPFASTSERNFSKHVNSKLTPGPGTYSTPSLGSVPQALDHWGHQKPSAAFAGSNHRFQHSKTASSPGPGSYSVPSGWKGKKKVSKPATSGNGARMPSAPSIPANHQTFGYDETTNGELILQKNPEVVHSGTLGDSVGPGYYNVDSYSKSAGPVWHKAKARREIYTCPTTGPEVGPGTYLEAKLNIGPMYKLKQSAVFMSKLREAELEVEEVHSPGPGSYCIEKSKAIGNSRSVPKRLQNFGSSNPRFIMKINESSVGPGEYSVGEKSFSRGNKESSAPFASSNARFKYNNSVTPGPGAYKDLDLVDRLNRKAASRQGAFGSSEKRFPHRSSAKVPGPGEYSVEYLQRGAQDRPNASFISKSIRGPREKTAAPPPGTYEIPSKFGASKPPSVSMHPVLSRVTKTKSEANLAFASRVERFESKPEEQKKVTPGPGSYDVKPVKSKKKVIVSKEGRFKNAKASVLPGPGAYLEENDEWNKKSYNVLFSEVFH